MQGEVRIAKSKPAFAAQGLQGLHEAPGFVGAPPTGLRIRDPRQGVENRVHIR